MKTARLTVTVDVIVADDVDTADLCLCLPDNTELETVAGDVVDAAIETWETVKVETVSPPGPAGGVDLDERERRDAMEAGMSLEEYRETVARGDYPDDATEDD